MEIYLTTRPRRRYGFWQLVRDILGLCIFNIFWVIWIVIRERKR